MPEPLEAEPTSDATSDAPKPGPAAKSEKPETDWKAEARKWESRAKENSTAATELAAIKDAQKTSEQILQERLAAAEKLADDRALDAVRATIALDKGLTASQAKRLVGTTEEELAADADDLLADLGTKSTSPRADHSQGTKNTASEQAPRELFGTLLQGAFSRS